MPDYRFHHIHLASPDPVKTAEFYRDAFDAEIATTELPGGNVRLELKLGGTRVLIMKQPAEAASTPSAAASGLDHLGLRTDDIETSVADLKARGMQFRDEIREIAPGVKISFFWAPENVLIELLEVKPDPQ